MNAKAHSSIIAALFIAAFAGLSGCGRNETVQAEQATGGDAQLGRELIFSYDCGSCHAIPGVPAADGAVGPPLERFGMRSYVAGVLPNSPDNLVRWIVEPHRVSPESAMPDLGVTPEQARHIAAYLYTLR